MLQLHPTNDESRFNSDKSSSKKVLKLQPQHKYYATRPFVTR